MRALLVCVAMLFAVPAWAVPDAASVADASLDTALADAKIEVKVATDEAEKLQGAVAALKGLFDNGWRAGIAGVIALLMFIWRKFDTVLLAKIPNAWLPLIVAGVAFLGAIPAALTADPWSWKTFLWQGLLTGAQAMAFWSIALKHLLKRFLPEGQ